jgi:hypothetical protein
MALGTSKISGAPAAPGVAAATSRVGSGRNVASAGSSVESAGFSPQVGINDNNILHYDQEWDSNGERRRREDAWGTTPLTRKASFGFAVEYGADSAEAGGARPFNEVLRGVSSYEATQRMTSPGTVKPGSVINSLT